jgi:hypothetical protein
LDLKYTRIEEVLRLAIAWYVRQGMITRPLPAFESA